MPSVQDIFFSKRTLIMGILNVTPDSFYDGGRHRSIDAALQHAGKMIEEGVDIIDVGGESTRPGSQKVDEAEELDRVVPVVEKICIRFDALVSIDTYKAGVARAALDAGAAIVNDISGVRFDDHMPDVLRNSSCPVVVMHIKGTPRDMQSSPYYDDVVAEVGQYFEERIHALGEQGIKKNRIILDPGIGFGKRVEDNLALTASLDRLAVEGRPILYGASRKSTIGAVLDLPPEERLEGTLALTALAVWKGARIIRVHDVRENLRVARMAEAVKGHAAGVMVD